MSLPSAPLKQRRQGPRFRLTRFYVLFTLREHVTEIVFHHCLFFCLSLPLLMADDAGFPLVIVTQFPSKTKPELVTSESIEYKHSFKSTQHIPDGAGCRERSRSGRSQGETRTDVQGTGLQSPLRSTVGSSAQALSSCFPSAQFKVSSLGPKGRLTELQTQTSLGARAGG